MEKFRFRLPQDEDLEFTGELVSRTSRELVHDPYHRTIEQYALYRTEDGRYILLLDSKREILAKRRYLRFKSSGDVTDYVRGMEGGEDIVQALEENEKVDE